MRIFIVFRDTIYVSGLRATLAAAPEVESVECETSIPLAWENEALVESDVVVLDSELGGAMSFVQEIVLQTGARVLLCLHEGGTADVLEAISHGASGALERRQLAPDTLLAAVRAVATGICAFDVGVLRAVTGAVPPMRQRDRTPLTTGGFAPREQMVLSLVAAGLSNREIAERLSYSERTIKTILHDVVIRLGVKSRSQAVAMAVRERII